MKLVEVGPMQQYICNKDVPNFFFTERESHLYVDAEIVLILENRQYEMCQQHIVSNFNTLAPLSTNDKTPYHQIPRYLEAMKYEIPPPYPH